MPSSCVGSSYVTESTRSAGPESGARPQDVAGYEALRAEINKLSHASRPEVDWQRIHQLASLIFEKHGVDLQTAIYFTLARSRLQGLSGFTEGCEFLANLIVTQWESFWPPVHQERARIEMLDWFIARISDVIRQYQISHEDKRLIYRCERALQLISEKLHNADLSRIPGSRIWCTSSRDIPTCSMRPRSSSSPTSQASRRICRSAHGVLQVRPGE